MEEARKGIRSELAIAWPPSSQQQLWLKLLHHPKALAPWALLARSMDPQASQDRVRPATSLSLCSWPGSAGWDWGAPGSQQWTQRSGSVEGP